MRLRTILALSLTTIVMLPIVALIIWTEYAAVLKEFRDVDEKHRLFAEQMSFQLARYADRVELFFASDMQPDSNDSRRFERMSELHVKCILTFSPTEEALSAHFCVSDDSAFSPDRLTQNFQQMLEISPEATNTPQFSGVVDGPNALPALYMYAREADGTLAAALLSTAFFTDTQSSLNFGDSGHAAIVDQFGQALAHPVAAIALARKDLSGVAPIREIVAGNSGTTQFFSPVKKKQMVGAYVRVADIGWGVMVNQAVEELEARAAPHYSFVAIVFFLGIIFAVIVGWVFSDYIARAILPVVEAAKRNTVGQFGAQIPPTRQWLPTELVELRRTFNVMSAEVQASYQQQNKAFDLVRKAQSADQAKSAFLANVSHELKTPLNAILGFTQLIRAETKGPIGQEKYREYLDNIYVSADHLDGLISNLLELSHAGKPEQQLQPVSNQVAEVVHTTIQMVLPIAAERDITLRTDPPIDPDLVIEADRHMLMQMLLNLISNAVKFSPAGGQVTLSAQASESGGIAISVADQGCGMAESDIPLAQQPFVQLKDNSSDDGVGLGLSLVKAMIERHNGRLEIHSKLNYGTVAILHFPGPDVEKPSTDDSKQYNQS